MKHVTKCISLLLTMLVIQVNAAESLKSIKISIRKAPKPHSSNSPRTVDSFLNRKQVDLMRVTLRHEDGDIHITRSIEFTKSEIYMLINNYESFQSTSYKWGAFVMTAKRQGDDYICFCRGFKKYGIYQFKLKEDHINRMKKLGVGMN